MENLIFVLCYCQGSSENLKIFYILELLFKLAQTKNVKPITTFH